MPKFHPPKLLPYNFERVDMRDFFILWSIVCFVISVFVKDWFWRISLTALVNFGVVWFFYVFAIRPVHPLVLSTFLNGLKAGAHRGLSVDAPENTLGAFRQSPTLGADSVEFDLDITKDGVAVVLHDETVNRTTEGVGAISNLTLDEVKKLNAAYKFGDKVKFPYEKIPTFDETIELLISLNMKMFIDVKNPDPMVVDKIVNMYKKHDVLYATAAVCSFFPQVVYRVKSADWRIITGHTWRPDYFTHKHYDRTEPYQEGYWHNKLLHWLEELYVWSLHRFYWKFTGASLFLTDEHCVSYEYAKYWRRRGMEVVAWTVNDYHQRLYYLNYLKIPFLTDQMSDIQEALQNVRKIGHVDHIAQHTGANACHLFSN